MRGGWGSGIRERLSGPTTHGDRVSGSGYPVRPRMGIGYPGAVIRSETRYPTPDTRPPTPDTL
jgi:hypothetical protein